MRMLMTTPTFHEIKLIWRPQPHTERLVVGTLTQEQMDYAFAYDGPDLARAQQMGFDGYPGLPVSGGPFHGQAMAAFDARNPSPARSDYERLLNAWAIPLDADPFTILGLTGGRLPTDLFEFIPNIQPSPGTEFISNLAGVQHYAEAESFRRMQPGHRLDLVPDPSNTYDPDAIKVMVGDNLVAYVKKGHSTAIASALRAGEPVECTLDRASINGVIREVLVRVRFM